jgi:hypothetical protein
MNDRNGLGQHRGGLARNAYRDTRDPAASIDRSPISHQRAAESGVREAVRAPGEFAGRFPRPGVPSSKLAGGID